MHPLGMAALPVHRAALRADSRIGLCPALHIGLRPGLRLALCLALCMAVPAPARVALAQGGSDSTAVKGGPKANSEFTQPGQNGAQLPEMVVEAQNQVRQPIQKGTFELKLTAALVDSFATAMDQEALAVSPVSGLQPHLNNLEPLHSDQTPHLWLRDMSTQPVALFSPERPEGHSVKDWELVITDFRGAPFRRYAGKGSPAVALAWDGRADGGDILQVGYPYSYVFSITDKGTNRYNYAGTSFRVPALDYRDGHDRVLEVAGGELFLREDSKLTDAGKDWLTKAADAIRQHPYSPVKMVVVAEDQALAQRRADIAAVFLAESLVLPREQVETQAVQRPDLRAELDGSLRVVVLHAD
jgi:hypothetical protein